MSDKLTRAQRQQIIFNHLRGKDDPAYEVIETNHGKYIVKPKQIELEEESINEEPNDEPEPSATVPITNDNDKAAAKRERRKRNRRAKQDAKRILDALTNLINNPGNDDEDDSSDDIQRAPPLVEPNNFNPQPQLSYRRRRLAF